MKSVRAMLSFEGETPTLIHGIDEDGYERLLPKREIAYVVSRDAHTIWITAPAKVWSKARRGRETIEKLMGVVHKLTRKCLRCSNPFTTTEDHRICPACKQVAEWRYDGNI